MTLEIEPAAWIEGAWHKTKTIPVTDPATLRQIGVAPDAQPEDMHTAAVAARMAFDGLDWPRWHPHDRAAVLAAAARLYEHHERDMARLITAENGSPAWFTAQTQHPLGILEQTVRMEYLLAEAPRATSPETAVFAHREPVGVCALIVPWNMPQKTIMMKLAPALLAGCTVVLKPAPQTPLDGLALGALMRAAGLPDGVLNIVPGGADAGWELVQHPAVDKVAFTGSTLVGRRVAAVCGQELKHCSTELGGKSACILLDDADLDKWQAHLLWDSFLLSGQICSNQTRIIAPNHMIVEVVDRLLATIENLREHMGDPTKDSTLLGPLVSLQQRNRVLGWLDLARQHGGNVTGGMIGKLPGWYLEPALITALTNEDLINRSEIFGPVVSVIPHFGVPHAIDLANDNPYGLAAGVWTADLDQARQVAKALRVGTVHVNGAQTSVAHPLGGYKESGIGRELGPEGLAEYCQTKVVAAPGAVVEDASHSTR